MSDIVKDPDNKIYHTVEWDDFLASDETLTASLWIMPTDLVEEAETSFNPAAMTTTIVMTGGLLSVVNYSIINRITYSKTADPSATDLTQDLTLRVRIKEL